MADQLIKPRIRVGTKGGYALVKATEGAFRPGPYHLPITGGWLPDGAALNWWQQGYDPVYMTTCSAMVEACVSAYSQTVAMCPGDHWRLNTKGGRDRVKTSALARILRYPNDYQTISDFMLNMVRQLYITGNAYALGLRNSRFEISELHQMNAETSFPRLSEDGEIFYFLNGNDIVKRRFNEEFLIVPRRDVLHIRLHDKRKYPVPLIGESPILAAYGDMGVANAISKQQASFYLNEARPSAVLSTDLVLDKDQVQALRDRWNEQVKGFNQGGSPILTAGLKVQPWAVGGKDAATAEILKLSNEHIALAFRVPLQVLGLGGAPLGSTEAMMQLWIASGLGFCLNHVEEAIGILFQLKGVPDEYVEFDTAALLRSAMKDRIEALVRGVQGGIFAPNEARNLEGYDSVKFGDEPRVQQQVVPLSAAAGIPPAPPAPPALGPPDKKPVVNDGEGDDEDGAPPPPEKDHRDDIQREVTNLLRLTDRVGRQRRYSA
jgi:HK97 family phage portal protein